MITKSYIKGFHRTLHWNVVNGYIYVIIVVVVNDVCESVFTLNFSSLFIYPQIILIKIHFQQQFQTHKQKIKKQKRDSHSKVFLVILLENIFQKKPQLIFTSFHKLIFKINPKYFNIFFLFHFVGKIRNKGVKSQETRIYRRKIFWNIILHWERYVKHNIYLLNLLVLFKLIKIMLSIEIIVVEVDFKNKTYFLIHMNYMSFGNL